MWSIFKKKNNEIISISLQIPKLSKNTTLELMNTYLLATCHLKMNGEKVSFSYGLIYVFCFFWTIYKTLRGNDSLNYKFFLGIYFLWL